MAVDVKKWSFIGFKIIMALPTILSTVENIKKLVKGDSQLSKEDAAVQLLKDNLALAEDVADRDLLNDPAVEDALRNAIKAIVNVQNVISAVKAAKV